MGSTTSWASERCTVAANCSSRSPATASQRPSPADGQCPALVMDELADGRLVVFVPASPAPMSGAVYVFAPDKVTYLNVPVLPFLKVISSWGLGLREIIEAQAASQGTQANHERPEPATSAAGSIRAVTHSRRHSPCRASLPPIAPVRHVSFPAGSP